MTTTSALVLFSGGQDSTDLPGLGAWRASRASRRSASTTASATPSNWRRGRASWRRCASDSRTGRGRLGDDHLLPLDVLKAIGGSALTDDMTIEMGANGLPTTFVPGRNLLFLTAAAALGYRRGIADLVGGMCETDFSGYPDCRDETIQATAQALSLGTGRATSASTRR